MSEIHVSAYAKKHGQRRVAEIIGCSQSAVSQMIRAKRQVFIVESAGAPGWFEIKGQAAVFARVSDQAA